MFIFGYSLNTLYIRFLRSGKDLSRIAIRMIVAFTLANAVMAGFGKLLCRMSIEFAGFSLVFFFLHHFFSWTVSRRHLSGGGTCDRGVKTP